ncbi:MAG: endonuclease V, partial [Gemmataceae bacterium]
VDVDYRDGGAVAAAVCFGDWADGAAVRELTHRVERVEEYEPGAFYKRELPCLLAVLAGLERPEVVVVDGYVWLGDGKPGLGAHLFRALGEAVPVVGVAKTRYASATAAVEVHRGEEAKRPLYVSAAGVGVDQAAGWVRAMHGPHRLPTLLKRVDSLCRSGG